MKSGENNASRLPKILKRTETIISPWVRIVAKSVRFDDGLPEQMYHCLAQADYVTILAQTPKGLIPIVRQYRPAIEAYTWELPAGLMEPEESPEDTCRRELKEETGTEASTVESLGVYFPDTGRFENCIHVYYAKASDPLPNFIPEPGLEIDFVSPDRLIQLILSKDFQHQLHLGAILLAQLLVRDWKWPQNLSA